MYDISPNQIQVLTVSTLSAIASRVKMNLPAGLEESALFIASCRSFERFPQRAIGTADTTNLQNFAQQRSDVPV
jgi:hypothetical protein